MSNVDPVRVRLGRIRCLVEAIGAMRRGEQLPAPLCFVPSEQFFEVELDEALQVYKEPLTDSKVVGRVQQKKAQRIQCSGLPRFNSTGGWCRMTSPLEGWALLQPTKKMLKGKIRPRKKVEEGVKEEKGMVYMWLQAVELVCPLQILNTPSLKNKDEEAMATLQTPPPGWNMEADEELAQFLVTNNGAELMGGASNHGKGKEHFINITSSTEESEVSNVLDPDPEVYWESDGRTGTHWLRFFLTPGTIIEQLSIVVDPDDGSYLPRRVVVKVGSSPSNVTMVHSHSFTHSDYDKKELQLFPVPQQDYNEVVEVHVKSCYQGGIDVRIRGVSLVAKTAETIFLASESIPDDIFTEDKVSRYPKLQGFESKQLYHRALVLSRLSFLLDYDLTYLLPNWDAGIEGAKSEISEAVSAVRQLWPMSRRRTGLISQMLGITATSAPSRPTVYIDRMAARRHQENPSRDKGGKMSVFIQLQRELKKHTKESNYNYRWAGSWNQWWECKFAREGIIDQGGGFRDLLSDIAEELCPSSPDSPLPLPLFIRSPNQKQDSSNAYRDNYIPNPKCTDFARYVFVGQLMGAMLRSQESLVLCLSQFLWKQLVGEAVTWSRDFVTVDSAEVRFIESIENMKRERFDDAFAGALSYTTVLSGGEVVPLVEGGTDKLVAYDDRLHYCQLVKERRMREITQQVDAIRRGFIKVVPPAVLRLLTWQEVEIKVCGRPEISIDNLKKSTRYDGSLSAKSKQVELMWQALEQFTNEERSRFLRFITGRRRLPCTIYIDSADGEGKLPTSATCSNTLYLPKYANVEEAVDRLRYAAYNCVAIDTDMTVWE